MAVTSPLRPPRPRHRRARRRRRYLPLALLVAVLLVAVLVHRVWAVERLPIVLVPSSESYGFPPRPRTDASAAPAYLQQMLPILKQAIRARLTVEQRLRATGGNAPELERVLQEYAGAQQLLLRGLSKLPAEGDATRLQREVVLALYYQMQFFRHFATWLHDDPRHSIRDERADSRLQGCSLALDRASALLTKVFPRLGPEEQRVFREHLRALHIA